MKKMSLCLKNQTEKTERNEDICRHNITIFVPMPPLFQCFPVLISNH